MAKYKSGFFIMLKREIFTDEYKHLSYRAKWLYVVLNELEHHFTNGSKKGDDFFFRSNEDLARDASLSLTLLKQAKSELLETNLVESWQIHFTDPNTKKLSKKKVTAYKIL